MQDTNVLSRVIHAARGFCKVSGTDDLVLLKRDSSPGQRRGGCASSRHREASSVGRRSGGSFKHFIYRSLERTTPSAPSKEASRYFLEVAATPPLPRRGVAPSYAGTNYLGQLWSQIAGSLFCHGISLVKVSSWGAACAELTTRYWPVAEVALRACGGSPLWLTVSVLLRLDSSPSRAPFGIPSCSITVPTSRPRALA
jgi:hypothetical protein